MNRAYSIHGIDDKCKRSRFRWLDSVKMYLREIGMNGVSCGRVSAGFVNTGFIEGMEFLDWLYNC
jgi:hypothetical protein